MRSYLVTRQWTGASTNWCIMVEMAGSNTNGTRKRKAETARMAIVPDLENETTCWNIMLFLTK